MTKEQGTRVNCRAKNGASKRAGWGWEGKEGNACRQTPGFLTTAHLVCHAWVRATTFDAVISCHNWPIKCLAFRGAEMNFRGRVCETKIIYFLYFGNAWTALMVKSQWIQTINAGFARLVTRNRRHFAPAKYLARGFKLSRWRHKESSTWKKQGLKWHTIKGSESI